MNTNVVGHAVSDANDLTTEMVEVTEFRQNERNFQNRGKGISEIEGKGAMGSAERGGSRASFNRGNGISEIEGKVARVAMSEVGSRASFKPRIARMTRIWGAVASRCSGARRGK